MPMVIATTDSVFSTDDQEQAESTKPENCDEYGEESSSEKNASVMEISI